MEELLERVKEEQVEAGPEGMLFDATAEFCRTLGEAPAYFAKQNPHSPVSAAHGLPRTAGRTIHAWPS